jgi:hypothetical protein
LCTDGAFPLLVPTRVGTLDGVQASWQQATDPPEPA